MRRRVGISAYAKIIFYFAAASALLGWVSAMLEWWGIALIVFCILNTFLCGYLLSKTSWLSGDKDED